MTSSGSTWTRRSLGLAVPGGARLHDVDGRTLARGDAARVDRDRRGLRNCTPFFAHTGASGKTTSFLDIFPTPTQILLGIQFHWELGDTTVTV